MGFWEKIFGKEPTPEQIAEFLKQNSEKQRQARRERAVKNAHAEAHRGNNGAIGDLTEEALEEFERKSKE
jgi:hypothetical protein